MKTIITVLLLVLAICHAHLAYATLHFEEEQLSFKAEMGQKETIAIFPFKNVGEEAVTIKEVKTSCGCTTPQLDKKVYEPGESGEIKLVFDYGSRTGMQNKTAYVVLSDNPKPLMLKLTVEIPVAFKVSPPLLYWSNPDEPVEMKSELKFFIKEDVEITEVKCLNPAWEVRAEPRADEEGVYDLVATPLKDVSSARATVLITTEPELDNIRLYLRGR